MRINEENKSIDIEVRDINYILPAYVRSYQFYSKNEMPTKIVFPMFPSVRVGDIEIPIEYISPLDPVAAEIAEDGKSVAEVTPEQEAILDEKDEENKRLRAEVESLTTNEQGGEEGGTQIPEPEFVAVPEDEKVEGLTPEEESYELAKADLTPAPEDLIRQQEEAALPDESVSPAKAAFAEPDKPAVPAIDHDRIPKQPPGGDIGPGLGLSDMHARDRRDQVQTARDLIEEPAIDESEEKDFDKEVKRDGQGRPVIEDKPADHPGSPEDIEEQQRGDNQDTPEE